MTRASPASRRTAALVLLALGIGALHALLALWLLDAAVQLGEGRMQQGPARLQAQFVAELRPSAPPPVAPRPVAARPVHPAAVAAAPAASAPEPVRPSDPPEPDMPVPETPAPETPVPDPPRQEPAVAVADAASSAATDAGTAPAEILPPPPEVAASAVAPASGPEAVAAATDVPPAFEWPRSTRLSYRLHGYYRGPVDGQASVEWLREGRRYQVHVEVSVGPSFAPLLSRRMSSDGDIGADGLTPRRYDEETRVALRSPRRLAVQFDGARIRLPNGQELPRPAGVQDTASQFVQLTWLFTTQPQRLRSGESVELMLALPRRVDAWVYDVLDRETLATGAGPLEAWHVRPRRPARPGGDLTAEMWVAPTLQYLPVRIVIRQDEETFVDLLLQRLPQQAVEVAR